MTDNGYRLKRDKLDIPSNVSNIDELWADDVLGRREIAEALTKLVRDEEGPLVISLDGDWGTGKTFLLEHWQKQLEMMAEEGEGKDIFKAIYYNAWEDDFHNNPLVSIIGQLSVLKVSKWGALKESLANLLKNAELSASIGAGVGVATAGAGVSINLSHMRSVKGKLKEIYNSQGREKELLRCSMKEFTKEIKWATKQSLVFIIDELDRCRPTYTIELLERIKHIFDVPNMIFVLGINKEQLCKSIRSVYGDIKAEMYLRRFIDMEFMMPAPSLGDYYKHQCNRYGVGEAIQGGRIEGFPFWCNYMGLSLRDVDDCVRSMVFVSKMFSVSPQAAYFVAFILSVLRIKKTDIYRQYVSKDCEGADVMNYISSVVTEEGDDRISASLNELEACLYVYGKTHIDEILRNLEMLKAGPPLRKEVLSRRVFNPEGSIGQIRKGSEHVEHIIEEIDYFRKRLGLPDGDIIIDISNYLELCYIPND